MKTAKESLPNELLIYERDKYSFTQEDVAQRIGAPDAKIIGRWERGITTPTPHYRQQLMQLFGKSARELGLGPKGETAFWHIPYQRNTFFTGRSSLLAQLHDAFNNSNSPHLPQALCGLGGIGKTQSALEYAYRYQEEYQAIFWVRAHSKEALFSDILVLAHQLHIPNANTMGVQQAIAAVQQWLGAISRWLLIFDDVTDFHLLDDVLPPVLRGHVLLTTRTSITGTFAQAHCVPVMTPEESVALLLQRAKILANGQPLTSVNEKAYLLAHNITRLLGYFPLALDQAGAYIEETGCGLAGYLERYQHHRGLLLNWRGKLISTHPEPVVTCCQDTFALLAQHEPIALELLHLLAFLDRDLLPEDFVICVANRLGSPFTLFTTTMFAFDAAITALRTYSLLERDAETRHLSTHSLVRTIVRDSLDAYTHYQWTERLAQIRNSTTEYALLVHSL